MWKSIWGSLSGLLDIKFACIWQAKSNRVIMWYGNEWYVRVCCSGVIQGGCGQDERGFNADTRHKLAVKAYLRRHHSCKKGKEMYLSFDHLLWGLYMLDYPISKCTLSWGPQWIIWSCRRLFDITPTRYSTFKLTGMEIHELSKKKMEMGRLVQIWQEQWVAQIW